VTVPVIIGAFGGWLYERRVAGGPNAEAARRLGVLLVSGYIVGDSLLNVVVAGVIAGSGNGAPLAVVPENFAAAQPLAVAAYALVCLLLYAWVARKARP
jgi:hypothetical protein